MVAKITGVALAVTISFLGFAGAQAQDNMVEPVPSQDNYSADLGVALDCCCSQSGWLFDAEAAFLRFHNADGVRAGENPVDDAASFDFEITPRLTFGRVGCDGTGVRMRYWEFDHTAVANEGNGSGVFVDTYTLDFEVFQEIELNCCTSIEFSAGLRYNEYDEVNNDFDDDGIRFAAFDGWGGILGAEVRRDVSCYTFYGRFRQAILTDDKSVFDDADGLLVLEDSIVGVTEVAFGLETSRCLNSGAVLTMHAGLEWQLWHNYSNELDLGTDDSDYDGSSDVGFAGFVIGGEVAY